MGVCLYHIHNPAEKTNNAQHNFHFHTHTHTHTHFLLPVLPPFLLPFGFIPSLQVAAGAGTFVASTGTVNGVRRDPTYPESKQRANVPIWDDR